MATRLRSRSFSCFAVALGVASISAGCADNDPVVVEPTGSGSLAVTASGPADVAGFQIDVMRGGETISSQFVVSSTSSGAPRAALQLVLDAASYGVSATPMHAPGEALEGCAPAHTTVVVQAGKTSTVSLNARCQSRPGAIDVNAGANFEPEFTSLSVEPSTRVAACQPITLRAEASDADGDSIDCELALLPGEATRITSKPGSTPGTALCEATIEPPLAGEQVIQLSACDAFGCGTLEVPLAVSGSGACTPSCDDENPCTEDSHDENGVCSHTPVEDGALCKDGKLHVKLLGINDFHGQLETGKKVSSRPAGGAAVLAAYLNAARAGIEDQTIIVHAGDHVGASPPASALLQDEPSIAFLNLLGNDACTALDKLNPDCNLVGTLGNHEFDEGKNELLRLLNGGNFSSGPFLEDPYPGARFPYVSANVIDRESGQPLLRPFVVKRIHGVPIGFVGAVLKATPTIVTPTGVAGLEFIDEADAINAQVDALHALGVHSIVVTIHQGGFQTSYNGPTRAASTLTSGPEIVDIINRLDDDVDVVVSGHTHSFTNAYLPNQHGKQILVTQAFSSSTAYDDIDVFIDPVTRDIVQASASIVTTWGDAGPGLKPDLEVAKLVSAATAQVAPLVNQVFGTAPAALTRNQNSAGESALGDLIADAQLAAMASFEPDFVFMNPGGIRGDLDAGEVTFGDLFTIQPFGNTLVKLDMKGADIVQVLEQQWAGSTRTLQIAGFDYTWDPKRPVGGRVVEVRLRGVPIDPSASYVVVCNNFLATGGDNFSAFKAGINQVGGPVDLDALIEYVEGHTPLALPASGRIKLP